MRIRKDKTSWKASGVLTRDARHERGSDEHKKVSGKKKDTRRWCRGKAGKEHKPEWSCVTKLVGITWLTLVCISCKKHLDYCWPFFGEMCKGHKVPHD